MRALLPFLVLLAVAQMAGARDIPFDYVDGYIVIHAQVGKEAVKLVLDSGASASVLSLDAARRIDAKLGAPLPVDGVEADGTAFEMKGVMAVAAGKELEEIHLAVDLSNARALCREHVDGLIGADFFTGRVTQIDYVQHCVRLLDAVPASAAGTAAERLPMAARNGVFLVPVSVNGSRPRWTRIDTGCNDALHWVVPRQEAAAQRRGVSIGFITDTADETLVDVRLGKLQLPHVETALHGEAIFPGEAGLLGSEVLGRYRVTMDARAGRFYLEKAAR